MDVCVLDRTGCHHNRNSFRLLSVTFYRSKFDSRKTFCLSSPYPCDKIPLKQHSVVSVLSVVNTIPNNPSDKFIWGNGLIIITPAQCTSRQCQPQFCSTQHITAHKPA